MVLEFLLRVSTGLDDRGAADARRDARGDGPRRHLRPARRRLRALRRRPRLGGAALREDALRQRPADGALRPTRRPGAAPGRDRDGRLRGPRARHRRGRLRVRAGRRQRGRAADEGGEVLRLDAGPARRGARARTTAPGPPRLRRSPRPAPSSTAPRRSSCWSSPTTAEAELGRRTPPPARRPRRARPAGARRQGRRRLERTRDHAGSARSASASIGPTSWRPRSRAGELLRRRAPRRTGGCSGSPATASPAPTPACWRTTAASRAASSPWRRRPPTRAGSTWPAPVLEVALTHFRADDGGFHDTADDAEALVARPRDPSDNASPSGLSSTVHALVTYAALTGSGRHREAAEQALSTTAALAAHAPRFAGWSLAAAVAMLDGPARDRRRRTARRGARRAGPGGPARPLGRRRGRRGVTG